ncbi:LOW QUALITY PROTEIN: zf-RVT domain-containing protein, partial [Cephalotus follicularis]
ISEGFLLVRYLGLPLLASRLSHMDCKVLIYKLMRRTSSWVSNVLSFGGRLQLLASVLFSIQVFWCTAFILPVSITKECNRILRNFLWHGVGNSKKSGKVAWSKVCRPKDEGGLGIKDCRAWNKAAIMKFGSQTTSWSWRNILLSRNFLVHNVLYEVVDGSSFSLWFDPWFFGESIADLCGCRVIQDSGMPSNAKVSNIISVGQWDLPLPSGDLIDISYVSSRIPLAAGSDKIHWLKEGSFTINEAWMTIIPQSMKVEWSKVVWFPRCTPKHSFCVWLAFSNGHRTLDKLFRWGVALD